MIFAPWKVKAIGALALVAILAGTSAGWWFTKTAYERDISDLKGEQARERDGWLKEKLAITVKAKLDTDAAIARMKDAQGELARIDAENQRKLADAEQKMRLFAVMLPLAIAGCASSATSSVVGTPQAEVPAPAAWAMTPASNSLQLLDELFSISEPVSSQTGQK